MPIIKDAEQTRKIINDLMREKKSIPCFCTESVYTTEAIFKGTKAYKEQAGIAGNMPLIIAFTASYEDRQQLKNYTGLSDFREGILAVMADIERLARPDGPYCDLDIMIHLDHAQPGKDNWIIEEYGDRISSVMWDCSKYRLTDNIAMMKDFIRKYRSLFVVEGAVDEIYNYSPDGTKLGVTDTVTDPETAERFFRETGCDLIVANLGTEHRRTEGTVKYHGDKAREISSRTGPILVLHGTSSLNEDELKNLRNDGIIKVNLWGNLESKPGKSLAETIIRNLHHILPEEMVVQLIKEGYLNEKMKSKSYKPSIAYLTEKYRRDEVYLPEAVSIIRKFYSVLYG
ncbi:MAG: class II fructose-bisphosphate aldolase [Bacteroidota bacterium]